MAKKSSYKSGVITVGYKGKKYTCITKAMKAARRKVLQKRGEQDCDIYEYCSIKERA